MIVRTFSSWFVFCFLLSLPAFSQAKEIIVTTNDQAEIPVTTFETPDNSRVLLWLPTEYGIRGREDNTAKALAKLGITVWLADLHGAYFKAAGRSSYHDVNINDIVDLIMQASQNKKREVILFATGRATPLALKATRNLQLKPETANIVKRAVLFHPNFYTGATDVGQSINYLPITYATNLSLYIVQPGLSGKTYQLSALIKHLQTGGSDVMSQILPGVGDGYNVRHSDDKKELEAYNKTPAIIYRAINALGHFTKPRLAAKLPAGEAQSSSAFNVGLQPYNGNIKALYLDFNDRKDLRHTLELHRGKVLLLNFWASWCPPCVKELPSLNRLQQKLGTKYFTILAINIGEDKKTVTDFLRPMNLDFPILFDPDAKSVEPWNLIAFPSSFVIDTEGKIRYGLFGGIEWDNEDIVETIKPLLKPQS